MDWDSVEEWKLKEAESVLISESNIDKVKLALAQVDELNKWKENHVYETVDSKNQKYITTRWVNTEKYINGEQTIKSRLVARGFQEENDNLLTDSPTCTKEGLRLSMIVIASKKWTCCAIDIKSAFLQGRSIEREVYVKPPKEAGVPLNKIWKLKKNVYGISDASRSWYFSVKETLVALDCQVCLNDPCIFVWYVDTVQGIICVHVDDFIYGGTDVFLRVIIDPLQKTFKIGSKSTSAFRYLGLNLVQQEGHILMDQSSYIESVSSIDIHADRKRDKSAAVTESELAEYRAIVGQLGWIAQQTRPDLSFDVADLRSKFKCATVKDLFQANKVVAKARCNPVTIKLGVESLENCQLVCYNDASFGNLSTGGSQGGYVIFLKSCYDTYTPISWESKKLRRVVKSTMAAETLELVECAEAAFWIGNLLKEMLHTETSPDIVCNTDSHQLYDGLYSIKPVKDKRL